MPVSSVPLSETHMAGRPRTATIASSSRTNPQSRQRGVGDQRQAFAREVVDNGENAEAAAVGEGVGQEVEAPALVRPLWDRYRRPRADRSLASAPSAYLQPFLAIETAELLMVHDQALTAHQNKQAAIAEPAADGGQLPQACAHDGGRCDGDERAAQGLGVHRAPAGRRS
jgi:hypothetical protein